MDLDDAKTAETRYRAAALEVATKFVGHAPSKIHRFTTGSMHYVFEAMFEDHAPLVVRVTRPEDRTICENAAMLSRTLRPIGVPLPELLGDGAEAPIPYLLLERLPGKDLGDVIHALPTASLDEIASRVADMQAKVAATSAAARYGYAASADQAPYETWAEVLDAHLHRSRTRISAAALFDDQCTQETVTLIDKRRSELNAIPSTPFLHDTTVKNVIVSEQGHLTGIVNVDDLCFGDPRYVIALTLTAILNRNGPAEYVDIWLERAAMKRDRLFWLYVLMFVVDFMSEHGQVSNGNERHSSREQRQHLTDLFEQTLQRTR